jgi:hypothetical protein
VSIKKQSPGGLFNGVQKVQVVQVVQNVWNDLNFLNDLNGRQQRSYAAAAKFLVGSCAAGS